MVCLRLSAGSIVIVIVHAVTNVQCAYLCVLIHSELKQHTLLTCGHSLLKGLVYDYFSLYIYFHVLM